MMREVLTRRYARVASGEEEAPDLVLVDGGKGQLAVAVEVLEEQGVGGCDVAALAKARSRGGERVKVERVFLPGAAEPIVVPEASYGFRLVTRVRDEAHRFAVSYHRKVRRKASMRSPLLDVPGVGPVLARRLTDHFGGLNKVQQATREELTSVRGVSGKLADALLGYFKSKSTS